MSDLPYWLAGPSREDILESFKLVPKEIRAAIPKRSASDDSEDDGSHPVYYARIYAPWKDGSFGGVSWYIEHLDPEQPDLAHGCSKGPVGTDWGAIPLSFLARVRGPGGARLVRDPKFVPGTPPRDVAFRPPIAEFEEFISESFLKKARAVDISPAILAGMDPGDALRPALRHSSGTDLVAELLKAGANAEDLDSNLRNLLHEVASRGAIPEMVALLVDHGARLGQRDLDGLTPLHLAAIFSDCPDVVQALIDAGAEVNSKTAELDPSAPVGAIGETPLHLAVKRSSPAVIKVLIESGADPTCRDKFGATPLHGLGDREGEYEEVVDLLLSHGADIHAADFSGDRPSECAFMSGCEGAWTALRERSGQSGGGGIYDGVPEAAREWIESLLRR